VKRYIYIATLAAMVLCMAGCEGQARKKNELVIWHVGPESQARTIIEISKAFTEKTGVTVACQAVSWGSAHSKYLTSIPGEVSPDIGSMGLTWGMEFGALGALLDLRAEYPEDVAELESKIFPGILHSTRVGDKVFGIPFDLSEQIIYYRKDMIPEPPENWEDFLSTLKALKARGKGVILDWESLEWIGYAPFLWQAGGEFYDRDSTRATLDTPEATEALNYMAELYANGVPKTHVPIEQGMRTGDYPLVISGNWKIISLTLSAPEIKEKWDIAMLPRGPSGKRTAFVGGRIMSIFSSSKMKDEAWEFIKFLFEPENQVKIYQASLETEDSYLPPNMDTWALLPMDKKFKKVLEDQAKDAKGPPPVLSWEASTRFVNRAIQMVIFKGADAATELRKTTADMQRELDRSLEMGR
jgi:multiple sugar transport system substrate-binding protein